MVFVGDDSGAVRGLDAADGSLRWQAHTGGAIFLSPAIWRGRLYAGSADGRVYAYEAATGRLLWSFRAAPADRWMPVYGRLMSTWPVAGGVAVEEGVVYAAAGIAHYDGTYVYALDAVTGRVKWRNDTSGNISEKVDCGVSLQGPLSLTASELRFLGGGKYETARYDRATGRCLNEPDNTLAAQFRTAFYPYFPDYGRYMSLRHGLADGKEWVYDASYEGSQHTPLALLAPAPPGSARTEKQESRWPQTRAKGPRRATLWSDATRSRFHSLIVTRGALLVAGHTGDDPSQAAFLAGIDSATGADLWRQPLPAATVRAGTAIDYQGRIIVTLENGDVLAFAGP
jgi:outer membrane protein assembly factor BamB